MKYLRVFPRKMKIPYNKKSVMVISRWPWWLMFAVAIGVSLIFFVKITGITIAEASRIPAGLEDEFILVARFLNSEQCFVYVDDSGTAHPKIIDADKFNQANLNRCFSASGVKYAFKLTLLEKFDGIGPKNSFGTTPIKTFNWNPTRLSSKQIVEEVAVYSNGIRYNGELYISIKNV